MARGYALLVGLKNVDSEAYGGWDGVNGCWGCELDVDNIESILKSEGYQTKSLKTAEATRNNILSSLYRSAENMATGDIFVFYYSGHGGQQPDINGDEIDGKDETLVAYDREIIDDKVHEALSKFPPGVRVVMISDSCNSGTNYRGRRTIPVKEDSIFRPIAKKKEREVEIQAQLIHLGGCRDGFSSEGYRGGGAFTIALCEAWHDGSFQGTFNELLTKIREIIRSDQQPQYNEYGPVSDNFKNQRAFKINIAQPSEGGPRELPVIDTEPISAKISTPGEKHRYQFIIKKEGKYCIETEGRTDIMMTLYGPDDETRLIKKDDDSGTGLNAKIVVDLSPGTYYVRIQHYNSETGTGAYSIKAIKL